MNVYESGVVWRVLLRKKRRDMHTDPAMVFFIFTRFMLRG